jgi:hypothetical protein
MIPNYDNDDTFTASELGELLEIKRETVGKTLVVSYMPRSRLLLIFHCKILCLALGSIILSLSSLP